MPPEKLHLQERRKTARRGTGRLVLPRHSSSNRSEVACQEHVSQAEEECVAWLGLSGVSRRTLKGPIYHRVYICCLWVKHISCENKAALRSTCRSRRSKLCMETFSMGCELIYLADAQANMKVWHWVNVSASTSECVCVRASMHVLNYVPTKFIS